MFFYLSHMGGIYTSDVEIDADSLYCEQCGDSDQLIGEADTFPDAFRLLRRDIFARDFLLSYRYRLLCEKFKIKTTLIVEDASDEEILREIRYIIGADQWAEPCAPELDDSEEMPCVMVAVNSALESYKNETEPPVLKENGYCTLQDANKYIRKYLPVRKRMDYKKDNRPKLKNLPVFEPAIVCVMGHYLYWHGDGLYESYFDNSEDEVVAVWVLKEM